MPLPEIVEAPMASQPLIGVIDTGFAKNNPYLDYEKITWGKDFIDHDLDPTWQAGENVIPESGDNLVPTIAPAGNEHGTHILGEIRELNQNAPIHAIRAVGSGQWAEALKEFVDTAQASGQPHAVVNLSMDLSTTVTGVDESTGDRYVYENDRYVLTPQERSAIAYAQEHNVLLVVSSGNNGMDDGWMRSTWGTAAQEFDNVLIVGAASPVPSPEGTEIISGGTTASTWDKTDFSGNGVGIVAAGGTLENPELSTVGDGLGVMAGTSVATAKVTAAAAQVWAVNPEFSYQQVVGILQATATDVNFLGWDSETGAGLLNGLAAVQLARVTTPDTVITGKTPVMLSLPSYPVADSAIATERPANAGVLGTPFLTQLVNFPLVQSALSMGATGLEALSGLIAAGGAVAMSPAVVAAGLAIGTVAATGSIIAAGKAIFDLTKAEAEAAANTVAERWCQANVQSCHSGEAGTWYVERTLLHASTGGPPGVKNRIEIGKSSDFGFSQITGNVWQNFSQIWVVRSPVSNPYYGLVCFVGDCTFVPIFVPANGGSASKTWAQLSEGVKQEIFDSGALTTALRDAALSSGVKGVFAPGSLAGQGLAGGVTVFGAGGTVGVINNANLSAYTKDCKWKFKFGKWLCVLDGVAYFPSNIPAATDPNSILRWIVGADGISEWIFRSGMIPAPKTLPAFPDARIAQKKTPVQGGGMLRQRWKDSKGKIYEWDYKKGAVEIYDKTGKKHMGEFDHNTGKQTGPAKPGRTVEK